MHPEEAQKRTATGHVGAAALARERDAPAAELREARAALAGAKAERADAAHPRAGEEHLRLVFECATGHAVVAVDREGRVTGWNSGARRIFGHEGGDVLGRAIEATFTPEDRAAGLPVAELCRAAEHGRAEGERWRLRRDGSRFWASGVVTPLTDGEGRLRGFLEILRDRTEARQEEERRALLLRELGHRVKNTLATVQSLAAQALRHSETPAAFRESFEARLLALARAHDLLGRRGWKGAGLRDVVERTLAPYGGSGGEARITAAGPPVRLTPNAAVAVNLAFHELATNAAKHGALSAPGGSGGRVEVAWALERVARGKPPAVEILWRERGGPPVRPPGRRGFGSRLIERGLAAEFGAEVRLDFAPEGVECRIRLPLPAAPREGVTR